MRKLNAPGWDSFAEDYEEIVGRSYISNKSRSELREAVKEQYRNYSAMKPDLEPMATIVKTAQEKRSLVSCYAHPHAMKVKGRILGLQSGILRTHCQMCSNMCLIGEFDHYLPKDDFPEFSVCAYNLVPCCHDCNGPRQNHWLDERRQRRVLHLYYDEVDEKRIYLQATISIESGAPRVAFEPIMPDDGDESFFERYCRHFETLSLRERYSAYYGHKIGGVIGRIKAYFAEGLDRDQIRRMFRRSAATEGELALAALYRAAADSDEFLEYALREEPQ